MLGDIFAVFIWVFSIAIIFHCPECGRICFLSKFRRVRYADAMTDEPATICIYCLVADRVSGANKYNAW